MKIIMIMYINFNEIFTIVGMFSINIIKENILPEKAEIIILEIL